jgi:hypothetical protein
VRRSSGHVAQIAALASGSTLAMTLLFPLELADPEVRPGLEMAEKGARASGTPFLSYCPYSKGPTRRGLSLLEGAYLKGPAPT